MSVQFGLALLALCSLAAAADPDCKELLKPLENRTQVQLATVSGNAVS